MRIVGGEFRSRTLAAPEGVNTRPTSDKVREALFNILQARVFGARVLDLYAGSGAISLEAVSRGAAFALMNDMSRDACRVIRKNIAALGCENRVRLLSLTDEAAVRQLAHTEEPFTLCFLDPPYRMNAVPVAESILNAGLLTPDALLIIEHAKETPPCTPRGMRSVSQRQYGGTGLSFFEPDIPADAAAGPEEE